MIQAVKYITPLIGWSVPHLMECSDGNLYVVKLSSNPQGVRALANEMISCWIAKRLNLPVPDSQVIYIHETVRNHCLNFGYDLGLGPHFGSRYVPDCTNHPTDAELAGCINITQAADIIAFDYWLDNNDRYLWNDSAQNILVSRGEFPKLWMIDNANIFNGPNWTVPSILNSVSVHRMFWGSLYAKFVPFLKGTDSFRQAIANITALPTGELLEVMAVMPIEWGVTQEEIAAVSYALNSRKCNLPNWLSLLQANFSV
ncbi:HipA family kinase [Paenibacillus sp. BAC0078]